jgi:hypothetical protein
MSCMLVALLTLIYLCHCHVVILIFLWTTSIYRSLADQEEPIGKCLRNLEVGDGLTLKQVTAVICNIYVMYTCPLHIIYAVCYC